VRWGSIDLKTLDSDTVIPILVFCLLLAWYLPAVVGKYRGNSSHALRHGAIWLGLIVMLVGGYAFRPELITIKDRIAGVLMPGRAIDVGGDMIVIYKRADEAHFNIKSYVNNQSAEFVLDTGASAVVLTHGTAQRLGLLPTEGGYTQTVSTANGMTKVAPIRIDELRIGSIIIKDIKASVAQPDELDVNLLGMSFLSRLKGYAVEADQLTLRQ
jgi:aspartyl protease family protein